MTEPLLHSVDGIISRSLVSTLFQPVVDAHTGAIFGYEALSRGPQQSDYYHPTALFAAARGQGLLARLDYYCAQQALRNFIRLGLPGKLFVNMSSDCLLREENTVEQYRDLLQGLCLSSDDIIIEFGAPFTQRHPEPLIRALQRLRLAGMRVSFDGQGVALPGLWSRWAPDFVKLGRHLFAEIGENAAQAAYLRHLAGYSHAVHATIVAMGVESERELLALRDLGVDLVQGFHTGHPRMHPPVEFSFQRPTVGGGRGSSLALDLVASNFSLAPTVSVERVGEVFRRNPSLRSIAIVAEERPVGLVNRSWMLDELSKPFGRELNGRKPVALFMERNYLCVEATLCIEQVSRLVTSRARYHQEDDFVIVQDGRFIGVGHVIDLLRQITELQVQQARHANPLTLLPGIVPINDCIESLVEQGRGFVVTYFDIDHFKPFNDIYGYARGDEVILCLGNLLRRHCNSEVDVCGHIGGDDFMVLWNSADWRERIAGVFLQFDEFIRSVYLEEHVRVGGFEAQDRHGELRFFPLVSLSVAALTVFPGEQAKPQEIASRMSPLKHAAKILSGHALILDHPANRVLPTPAVEPYPA